MYSIGYIISLLRAYVLLGIHTGDDFGVNLSVTFLKTWVRQLFAWLSKGYRRVDGSDRFRYRSTFRIGEAHGPLNFT